MMVLEVVRILVEVAPPPGSLTVPHPLGGVHGHLYPVVVMRDLGEDPRQSHLAAGGPVTDQTYQPGPGLLAVTHERRPRVTGTRPAQVLPHHAHLARGLLLLALPEVVLLDGHRSHVELGRGILAVQTPAAHPGSGAQWRSTAGETDGLDVGVAGGGVVELHHGDVVGEGGVGPEGPVRAETDAAVTRDLSERRRDW